MSLSLPLIEKRREQLIYSLNSSTEICKDLSKQVKEMKLEIANTKGAILELDRLLYEGNK